MSFLVSFYDATEQPRLGRLATYQIIRYPAPHFLGDFGRQHQKRLASAFKFGPISLPKSTL